MSHEFMVRRREEKSDFKRVGRTQMLARVAAFVGTAPTANVHVEDRDGKFETRVDAFERLRRLTKRPVGTKVFIEKPNGDEFVVIAVETSKAVVPDLGCAPELEKIHAVIWERYPKARSAGRFVCKFVSGTKSVSRHGFFKPAPNGWQGAAEDIFFASFDQQTQAANMLVRQAKAGVIKPRTIIDHDRAWTPERGWQPYGGVFHSHIHVDVDGGEACRP